MREMARPQKTTGRREPLFRVASLKLGPNPYIASNCAVENVSRARPKMSRARDQFFAKRLSLPARGEPWPTRLQQSADCISA